MFFFFVGSSFFCIDSSSIGLYIDTVAGAPAIRVIFCPRDSLLYATCASTFALRAAASFLIAISSSVSTFCIAIGIGGSIGIPAIL